MKTIITAIILAVSSSVFVGCSTTQSGGTTEPTAASPKIHNGMTKAQVIAAWGEPSGRQVSSSGEIWTWGGQRWKRMIPYAGPFVNVQTSKVVFGPNGRVRNFRLTDRGDAMTDIEGMSPGHLAW